jgi:hypothetical protein
VKTDSSEASVKRNSSTSNEQSQKAKPDLTERIKRLSKQLAQAFLMMQKPVPAYDVLTAIADCLLSEGFTDEQIGAAIASVVKECEWLTPKAIIERASRAALLERMLLRGDL